MKYAGAALRYLLFVRHLWKVVHILAKLALLMSL